MKKLHLVPIILIFTLFSCENGTNNNNNNNSQSITSELIYASDCKSNEITIIESQYTNCQSCVEYLYNPETKVLYLTHYNAGFNCCPGNISTAISSTSNSITVTEIEESSDCDCDCLYDLDIRLENVEVGIYTIKFNEPYCGKQDKIEFYINLIVEISGSHCVERIRYPWCM